MLRAVIVTFKAIARACTPVLTGLKASSINDRLLGAVQPPSALPLRTGAQTAWLKVSRRGPHTTSLLSRVTRT